jgi:hypothetical protein
MTLKKTPPKKHAPMNLAFINLPGFIKADNKNKAGEWIEILDDLYKVISSIRGSDKKEETGDTVKGLRYFRDFLSASQLDDFFSFNFWYAGYVVRRLGEKSKGRENIYVVQFHDTLLTKIYLNMDKNLSKIINNEGFKAIAKAIRKSTVSLQYTPKEQRKFNIRYGLAQQLQNKSKSKDDLAVFIGEFIGRYNAETAKKKEKDTDEILRANVKNSELSKFYGLLDKNPSRLVGAMLASYGFALNTEDKEKRTGKSELKKEKNTSKLNI